MATGLTLVFGQAAFEFFNLLFVAGYLPAYGGILVFVPLARLRAGPGLDGRSGRGFSLGGELAVAGQLQGAVDLQEGADARHQGGGTPGRRAEGIVAGKYGKWGRPVVEYRQSQDFTKNTRYAL